MSKLGVIIFHLQFRVAIAQCFNHSKWRTSERDRCVYLHMLSSQIQAPQYQGCWRKLWEVLQIPSTTKGTFSEGVISRWDLMHATQKPDSADEMGRTGEITGSGGIAQQLATAKKQNAQNTQIRQPAFDVYWMFHMDVWLICWQFIPPDSDTHTHD